MKASPHEAVTLGILLAGWLERERDSAQQRSEKNSEILCVWPLTSLSPRRARRVDSRTYETVGRRKD